MNLHEHVSVLGYDTISCSYCAKVGFSILSVCVRGISELYKVRIINETNNKTMNNLVDIRSLLS